MNWSDRFRNIELRELLERIADAEWMWIAKRLSSNDTGLTGGHQSGLYLPRWFFEHVFPGICTEKEYNPRSDLSDCFFPGSDYQAEGVSAIYYNSKFFPEKGLKKKYDEFRLTGWGGRDCPLQNPDNTGALFILAVHVASGRALGWVCSDAAEEAVLEEWLGRAVYPGEFFGAGSASSRRLQRPSLAGLAERNIPESWLAEFPSGQQVFSRVVALLPGSSIPDDPDRLLLERRDLEFLMFEIVEQAHVLPRVKQGFSDVSEFLGIALQVANRRKSRAGRSLELNLGQVFRDRGLRFQEQVKTELNRRPDFLFPSGTHYHDEAFPESRLHMLAAKTCCKDRWRQVLSEAARIKTKHLFTLQEGVSESQFEEMRAGGIVLVVPAANFSSFPSALKSELTSLKGFVDYVAADQKALTS